MRSIGQHRILRFLLGASVIGLASPVQAQEAEHVSDVQERQSEPTQGEVIVVTATKRAELLTDVPLAITALGEETLENAGVRNFADYARLVPGLSFSDFGSGRQKPALRGINVNTGAAVVGYYIDETPIPSTSGTLRLTTIDPRLFDVDRIEVLRGPQGTLYGAGSMGGTIRIIPNRPNPDATEGAVRLTGTLTDERALGGAVDAMVNVPVASNAALRVVGWAKKADGYIARRAGGELVEHVADQTVIGTRAVVGLYNGPLEIEASLFHETQRFDGFQSITFGPENREGRLEQNFLFDVAEPNRNRFTLLNLTAEYDLGPATLLSSTSQYWGAYRAEEETAELLAAFVGPTFPSTILEQNKKSAFTQEVRIASNDPLFGTLDYVVGAFYSHEKSDRLVDLTLAEYEAVVGTPILFVSEGEGHLEQTAVFGELSVEPVDGLTFLAGARYYDISGDDSVRADGLFNGGLIVDPESPFSSSGVVSKFNASWKPSANTLVYGQVAEGFRPGFGINPLPEVCVADAIARGIDVDARQVRSDKVWNYELGFKGSTVGNRLRGSVAAYRIDWSDIQLSVFLPCGFQRSSNAGNARVEGLELEAAFDVTRDFEIGGSLARTDAEFESVLAGTQAQPGDPILDVPKWSGAAYAEYKFTPFATYRGLARLDIQHTSTALLFFDRDPNSAPAPLQFRERPALTLLNARLEMENSDWSFALFGRNIFNQVEIVGFGESLSANLPFRPRFTVNQPRTIGIEVTRRF